MTTATTPTNFTIGLLRPSMPKGYRYASTPLHGSSYLVRLVAPPTGAQVQDLLKRLSNDA
jgi:hypothetical protein